MEEKQIPLSKIKSLAEKNLHIAITFSKEMNEPPLQGHLVFYDSALNSLYVGRVLVNEVLEPEASSTHYNLRVISLKSIHQIKELNGVQSLFKAQEFLKKLAQGGYDELWETRARQELKQASLEASTEGRFIFHCLRKAQYNCVWEKGVNIVIPEANVKISPPYLSENCSSLTSQRGAVGRIRTLLQRIRDEDLKGFEFY